MYVLAHLLYRQPVQADRFQCNEVSVSLFAGTPIQRGLEDVYGLLLFLGVEPYWVQHWWKELLLKPFCYGDKVRVKFSVLSRCAITCTISYTSCLYSCNKLHTFMLLLLCITGQHVYERTMIVFGLVACRHHC